MREGEGGGISPSRSAPGREDRGDETLKEDVSLANEKLIFVSH